MSIKIVTDSTAYLTADLQKEYDLTIVPLSVSSRMSHSKKPRWTMIISTARSIRRALFRPHPNLPR